MTQLAFKRFTACNENTPKDFKIELCQVITRRRRQAYQKVRIKTRNSEFLELLEFNNQFRYKKEASSKKIKRS
ncbi:MAG: hypothetical protein H0X03_09590 [Nitrosopumilus sp.]|nr:hypothetical protein [Nitrosopumilus sp.]MBA3751122.1 hypothetical protein [Nitrosopumilus sp.]